jgi:hypothetical protein
MVLYFSGHFSESTNFKFVLKICGCRTQYTMNRISTGTCPFFCCIWLREKDISSTCIKTSTEARSIARGVGFEPTSSFEHGISNPTPYQAGRPPQEHHKSYCGIILIVGIVDWWAFTDQNHRI